MWRSGRAKAFTPKQTTFLFTMIIHLNMTFMPFHMPCGHQIWLHKKTSNCFCCAKSFSSVCRVEQQLPSRTQQSHSIRLSVAINNRLPKSFITNLLTKFIFNFPSAACYSHSVSSIANLLTSLQIVLCSIHLYSSCKFSLLFNSWPIYQKLVPDDYE